MASNPVQGKARHLNLAMDFHVELHMIGFSCFFSLVLRNHIHAPAHALVKVIGEDEES